MPLVPLAHIPMDKEQLIAHPVLKAHTLTERMVSMGPQHAPPALGEQNAPAEDVMYPKEDVTKNHVNILMKTGSV